MKLKNIVFKTESGKKITLTIDEAKDLYQELGELLGTDINSDRLPGINPVPAYPWNPWSPVDYLTSTYPKPTYSYI